MPANDYQVGGNHYRSDYGHWDWVLNCGLGYLEGNATKYISRWRTKGGPQDLEKALHYVAKLRESVFLARPVSRAAIRLVRKETDRFCETNQLRGGEADAIRALATWETDADLARVQHFVQYLLDHHAPKPVPATDSNKHAERASQ